MAQYLENPRLVRLRLGGVPRSLLVALDRPWLRRLPVRTVIDVGANTGQFAMAAHTLFPAAAIHAFEPLPDCHRELLRRTARASAITAWNLALGEESGILRFERNDYTPSSSALPMSSLHRDAFPYTGRTSSVEVVVERLDSVIDKLRLEDDVLVKIDVQGFEDRVLRGGEQTVRRARVLIVETSFVVLYEGQAMHADVCHLLEGWGFCYVGALDQLLSPVTGEILSADSVFIRRDGAQRAPKP